MKLFFTVLIVAVLGGVCDQGYSHGIENKTGAGLPQVFTVAVGEDAFETLRDVLLQQQSGETNFYIGKRCVAVGFVSVKLFEGNPTLQQDNEKVRS